MISLNQIERMVAAGAYGRLAGRILANGRCGSSEARSRLTRPQSAPAAGLGLAVQRLCELTYGPRAGTAGLVRRLLLLQRPDGLFGEGPAPCPAASAVALRGLLEWRRQLEEAHHAVGSALTGAIERGVGAVAKAMAGEATSPADHTAMEIVFWQLGHCQAFRSALPAPDFGSRLARRAAGEGRDDLARFATAAAA